MIRAGLIAVGLLAASLALPSRALATQGALDPPKESPPEKSPDEKKDDKGKKDGNDKKDEKDPPSPPSPSPENPRKNRDELEKEWDEAYKAYSRASNEVQIVEGLNRNADEMLEPLRREQRRLLSRPTTDPERVANERRLRDETEKAGKGALLVREMNAREAKEKTRRAAIAAGSAFKENVFSLVEKALPGKAAVLQKWLDRAFEVMRDVEQLEQIPLVPVPAFRPPLVDESNPKALREQIALYAEDRKINAAASSQLSLRVEQYERERQTVVRLKELGVMMSEVDKRLGEVEARLASTTKARDAAASRAQDVGAEVDRLEKLLAELEAKKDSK